MKYCSNCGSKVNGKFCSNCGKGIDEPVVNSEMQETNDYIRELVQKKKYHSTFRLVVGIIMIIIGVCVFIASVTKEYKLNYTLMGYDVTLGFMIPGLFACIGGIFSIVSRKVNILLLIAGIFYILAAIFNVVGISDVSLLFILCCVIAPLSIVFSLKAQ